MTALPNRRTLYRSPIGPGPLVYAHRGARAYAPDNTIEAFELAVAQGADGVELDAWLTTDGKVVLFHDADHPELGWIRERSTAEVRRLAPSIPTLDEAFDAIGPPYFVNIELKNGLSGPDHDRHRRLAAAIGPIIDRHGAAERVLVSSFDPAMVGRVRKKRPDLLTGQLLAPTDPVAAIDWAADAGHDAVNVHGSWLAADAAGIIERAADRGLVVCVWTVNEPEEVRAFADAGAAVIITDDPPMALEALSAP